MISTKKDVPVLELSNLKIVFRATTIFGRTRYTVKAVNDVSFNIGKGQTFGLVGESGSGKTTIGKAILKLIDIEDGKIRFEGREVPVSGRNVPLSYRQKVQAIFQDPYASLNPSHFAGDIIGEPIGRHFKLNRNKRRERVINLLHKVGMSGFHSHRYTYELSGGQRQRIAIARALGPQPQLIVCDEPVSALDVSTQAQVINLLDDLQEELGISYLFIAHDLAVVRYISNTIGVLNLGWLVETGPSDRVYEQPAHPYTDMLLASIPVPNPEEQTHRRHLRRKLQVIVDPPSPVNPPPGCPYEPRCTLSMRVCRQTMPAPTPVIGGGTVRCHLHTSGPKLDGMSVAQLHNELVQ